MGFGAFAGAFGDLIRAFALVPSAALVFLTVLAADFGAARLVAFGTGFGARDFALVDFAAFLPRDVFLAMTVHLTLIAVDREKCPKANEWRAFRQAARNAHQCVTAPLNRLQPLVVRLYSYFLKNRVGFPTMQGYHCFMVGQLVRIAAILFSTVFFLMGNGLINTLTPLRADLEGFSDLALGALGSWYYGGFALGCLGGPYLFARTGHIRAFSIAAALTATSVLLLPILALPLAWFLLRALSGLCIAIQFMALESWLNERASNENRGTVLSTYIVVNLSAIILGQWLLLLAQPVSFELFTIGAICYCLCLIPVGLTRLPQPNPQMVPRLNIGKLLKVAPVGVAGCLTVGLANGAFWTLAPAYARSLGFDTTQLALFMSVFIAGGALAQWPLGRLSDRVDRRGIIALVCTAAAVSGIILGLFGWLVVRAPDIFYVLVFILGAAMLPLYSISIAHANDRLPSADFLQTSAGLLMVLSVASVAGPLMASFLTAIDPGALFIFIAITNALMAFFAFTRTRMRDAPEQEEREAFAALPQGSPAALPLDPRAPDNVT